MSGYGGYLNLVKTSSEGTSFEIGIPVIYNLPNQESLPRSDFSLGKLSRQQPLLIIEDHRELADTYPRIT